MVIAANKDARHVCLLLSWGGSWEAKRVGQQVTGRKTQEWVLKKNTHTVEKQGGCQNMCVFCRRCHARECFQTRAWCDSRLHRGGRAIAPFSICCHTAHIVVPQFKGTLSGFKDLFKALILIGRGLFCHIKGGVGVQGVRWGEEYCVGAGRDS